MGYYPILKFYLDQLNNKVFSWSVKYIVFNLAAAVFFLAFQYVFTSVDLLEGMDIFGKFALPVLWIMGNVFFWLYDKVLGQLVDLYVNWFRKKILRRK